MAPYAAWVVLLPAGGIMSGVTHVLLQPWRQVYLQHLLQPRLAASRTVVTGQLRHLLLLLLLLGVVLWLSIAATAAGLKGKYVLLLLLLLLVVALSLCNVRCDLQLRGQQQGPATRSSSSSSKASTCMHVRGMTCKARLSCPMGLPPNAWCQA